MLLGERGYAKWVNDDGGELYWLDTKGKNGPRKQCHFSYHVRQTSHPPDFEKHGCQNETNLVRDQRPDIARSGGTTS